MSVFDRIKAELAADDTAAAIVLPREVAIELCRVHDLLRASSRAEKVLVLDEPNGVKVGGRFDGWLMRRGADGQWVTVRRLDAEGPFDNAPDDVRALYGLPPKSGL